MSSEVPNYLLFEHAVGYTLFKVKEFEDIGNVIPEVGCETLYIFLNAVQVNAALTDPQRFQSIVQVHAFEPFKNTEAALQNCNYISEGIFQLITVLFDTYIF